MNNRRIVIKQILVLLGGLILVLGPVVWIYTRAASPLDGFRRGTPTPPMPQAQSGLASEASRLPDVSAAAYGYGDASIAPCPPSPPPSEGVWERYQERDRVATMVTEGDSLWAGTRGRGLLKWNAEEGSFTHYTQNDGLVSDRVSDIAVDSDGNKWVIGGYAYGLVSRFDGSTWTVLTPDNSGLPEWQPITAISADASGNVWFGMTEKIVRFDGEAWTEYPGLPRGYPRAITFEDGDVWVGIQPAGAGWGEPMADSGGLAKLSGTTWYTYTSANSPLTSNFVWSVAIDFEGNRWIGTDEGLNKLGSTGIWTHYATSNSHIAGNQIRAVAVDETGTVWAGTKNNGLSKFSGSSWTTFDTSNSGLVSDQIRELVIGSDGSLWIGTVNGVSRLKDGAFETYSPHNWDLNASPISVSADQDTGDLWVGTGDGVNRYSSAENVWNYFAKAGRWTGDGGVEAIALAGNDDIWAGTSDDLSVLPADDRTWIMYTSGNSDLPSDEITDVLVHPDGDVWITTDRGEIVALRSGSATWDVFGIDDLNVTSDYIYDIALDGSEHLWFGARGTWVWDDESHQSGHWEGGGLCKFDGVDWTCYTSENSNLDAHNVYAVAIAKDGSIWVGTASGARRFKNGQWTKYDETNSSLAGGDVTDVAVDEQGTVWFAVDGYGLAGYDGSSWSTARVCNSALDSNYIRDIHAGPEGNLLAVTSAGSFFIRRDTIGDCHARINDGATEYTSVQAAVDAASNGDVVKVAGYCDGVKTRNGLKQTVYINKSITVRGGYALEDWESPRPDVYPTTLDAKGQGRVVYVTGDVSATIEGLRITGGDAAGLGGSSSGDDAGGGIYVIDATLTVEDSQITGNDAETGGGIYFIRSDGSKLRDNTIDDNLATGGGIWGGGGMCASDSDLSIYENTIKSNEAVAYGGGIAAEDSSSLMLAGNSLTDNTAGSGGGIAAQFSSITSQRDQVTSNNADQDGAGFYLKQSAVRSFSDVVIDNDAGKAGGGWYAEDASPYLLHTTLARNQGASAIEIQGNSTATVTNAILTDHEVAIEVAEESTLAISSVLWHGTPVTVSQAAGAVVTIHNQQVGDPVFARDGYHLTGASAAIDQGVSSEVAWDIDEESRRYGDPPDLGADEYVEIEPATRYVAPDGIDAGGCTDSASPCATLQYAVDTALPGDEIHVAEGRYTGVDERDGVSQMVYLDKSVTIQGGYAATDWTRLETSASTILDAQGGGRVFYIVGDITPTIKDLTITGGDALGLGGDPWRNDLGGGIYVMTATLTLENCRVIENAADRGGGIYLWHSDSELIANRIANNRVEEDGGGIYLYSSDAALAENNIVNNEAVDGGGVYLWYSDVSLTKNNVIGNIGDGAEESGDGGGIYTYVSTSVLRKNTISDNRAQYGGGLNLYLGDAILRENVISGNVAKDGGGGMYAKGSDVTVDGNTVEDNEGRGVYLSESSVDLFQNTIISNTGGGLRVTGDDIQLSNNEIVSNTIDGWWACGGGLSVSSGESAVINQNRISANIAGRGGGVCVGDKVTLRDNTIQGNTAATSGGGIYLHGTGSVLRRNVIRANAARGENQYRDGSGGGLHLSSVEDTIIDGNVVVGNKSSHNGGGMYLGHCEVQLANNAVVNNQAGAAGGGVHIERSSSSLLHNTLVSNNSADGAAIVVTNYSWEWKSYATRLTNTIIAEHSVGISVTRGNTITVNGMLWHQVPATTSQNADAVVHVKNCRRGNPEFAPDGYHLEEDSFAIDKGVAAGISTDVDGELRIDLPDLGADEYYQYVYLPIISCQSQVVDGVDGRKP